MITIKNQVKETDDLFVNGYNTALDLCEYGSKMYRKGYFKGVLKGGVTVFATWFTIGLIEIHLKDKHQSNQKGEG